MTTDHEYRGMSANVIASLILIGGADVDWENVSVALLNRLYDLERETMRARSVAGVEPIKRAPCPVCDGSGLAGSDR